MFRAEKSRLKAKDKDRHRWVAVRVNILWCPQIQKLWEVVFYYNQKQSISTRGHIRVRYHPYTMAA